MDIQWVSDTFATEAVLLVCSFVLCGLIGLERELRQKSAGARTHILVGMGSALFTMVSSFGFNQVLGPDVVLDPSRIAAQVVTGIGFLGAGVIFVRRNIVSGLTTAASVWVTAAVGMACGAGMPVTAALTVGLYLFAVTGLTALIRKLPTQQRTETYQVRYTDGHGVLRDILQVASDAGYEMALSETQRHRSTTGNTVAARIEFTHGKQRPPESLLRALSEVDGVIEVRSEEQDHD